jgi:hypothetical protein
MRPPSRRTTALDPDVRFREVAQRYHTTLVHFVAGSATWDDVVAAYRVLAAAWRAGE